MTTVQDIINQRREIERIACDGDLGPVWPHIALVIVGLIVLALSGCTTAQLAEYQRGVDSRSIEGYAKGGASGGQQGGIKYTVKYR